MSCTHTRVILKQNSQRFFSADLSCESASHHFALFLFEMGSLVGFVVLRLPQYFLQHARKLAQIVVLKLHQYFLQHARKLAHAQMIDSDSQLQLISPDLSTTMPRAPKHRALAGCRRLTLVPCRRPPPFLSRRVVPRPRLSRLRYQSEGTAASPHPSPSRRRRGKIPSIVIVLRSDDDASRRPPPLL